MGTGATAAVAACGVVDAVAADGGAPACSSSWTVKRRLSRRARNVRSSSLSIDSSLAGWTRRLRTSGKRLQEPALDGKAVEPAPDDEATPLFGICFALGIVTVSSRGIVTAASRWEACYLCE